MVPVAFFEVFKNQLIPTKELTVIGYGFGDLHINEVLASWMTDHSNKIIIYDPYRNKLPDCLSAFQARAEIVNGGMTDFFLSIDSSHHESLIAKMKRKMHYQMRENLRLRRERASQV